MRRTSKQALAELHRLYDFFEALDDCWADPADDTEVQRRRKSRVSRERTLGALTSGHATASQLSQGVREALNDFSEQIMHLLQDNPKGAQNILRRYRERQGRELWDDIGHPKKLLKQILKRGRINNETEYLLLTAHLGDQAQQLMTPDEIERAKTMLIQHDSTLDGRPTE